MNKSTKCAVILYKHGFSGAKQIECKDDQNKTAVEIAFIGQADGLFFFKLFPRIPISFIFYS